MYIYIYICKTVQLGKLNLKSLLLSALTLTNINYLMILLSAESRFSV